MVWLKFQFGNSHQSYLEWLPIMSVSASLLNLLSTLTFSSPRKVISKLTLVLRLWLVCMTFFAIIPSHLRIHSSTNYFLIFVHVFTLISSITSPTNTPPMLNQSILSTHQFLNFIPSVRPTFPKYFFKLTFCFFYATPKFLPQRRAHDSRKGPPAVNDRRPEGGPEALDYPEAARIGEHLKLLPLFLGSPGREQSEPLTTVEACRLIITSQTCTELLHEHHPPPEPALPPTGPLK